METLPKRSLNFDDTEIAFRNKSDTELNAAYWLFKIISSNFLTKVGPPITNFFLNIGLPIKGIIKATLFKHFCGGETIAECEHTIQQLASGKVGTILDYSVEGEEEEIVFDFTCEEIIRTIERATGDKRIPITVFKVTGIGRFGLLEKLDAKKELNAAEQTEFEKLKQRCEKICRRAFDKNVPVMIDAEETWIQDTIDELAFDMMRLFNQKNCIVYNTYQLYRHDKLADLKSDHLIAREQGFVLGVKMVRGAYMEKERKRAEELGFPSPIQVDKAACDRDYDASLHYCMEHINDIAFVCGTHNENSCRVLAQFLDEYKIAHNHPHVYFAQLLGMSDNLSFNLSDAGYNVAKYVPYGPIKAVMPYLFRRAQENTSIAGATSRELGLIIKEKQRRRLK
ncbi:proline dehydrogenase family protein [Pedobacter heparinus]|uniref:Proline dehydrogenase n=1 Tax=Pedobacter heparinus (strain ATCC 13125 / DSM 2366 / CIP 104194 / JCM 7457 / NBRC 12017 / NCIMB 9290 / NRRL B-14731 / HIM 762-3) TaxID=485917 RepID=C6XTU4_PEDHD|nr:proline dehydrogenase family protein [Pedobacter heparinus]ACU03730.1 Proline dehydrogenase [Pedobacter heparinus DSM 2366]